MEFIVNESGCRQLGADMQADMQKIGAMLAQIESENGTLRGALGEDYETIAKSVRIMTGELSNAQQQLKVITADMEVYMAKVHRARVNIAGGDFGGQAVSSSVSTATGYSAPSGGMATGWCSSNSMSAVRVDAMGEKVVSMTIGGVERQFPCTKAGMEHAYDQALATGDSDLIARTYAMFEIETLRESLDLNGGDASYPQLGGYHRDVKKQDPKGFESHHIPSRTVQDASADWLPSISISKEDHKLTGSYSGKQRHVYEPFIPSSIPRVTYKESITQNLEQGSPGYINSVRSELLDLRSTTGHRYDGGVSGFLDAVIDMIAARGIPTAKR